MKYLFSLALFFCLFTSLPAQNVREELRKDIRLSASNNLAYPGPVQKRLTPAPDGKHAFYISHYGRHGSRYNINPTEYNYPLHVLYKADSLGKLTNTGKEILTRLETIKADAQKRLGELTELGAQQHRDIAKRMFERFPEVFEGEANIDARSTTVIRCILSMDNELLQLTSMNPKLRIKHDASEADMYYMNYQDWELYYKKLPNPLKHTYMAFAENHEKYDHLMSLLFNDTTYVSHHVNAERLNFYLFKIASNIQNLESRNKITLYDIFDDEEIYHNWVKDNAWWYLSFGPCPLNGGKQPFSQRKLLKRIIEQADSCIALPKPGANLRFGHETMVLPLVCLMGINGYDKQVSDLEQLERKGWVNYRIFPMAANVQFVFYRKNPKDQDVLVKVLLNENEATLPIKTDVAPYYHWNDFREHYLQVLESYTD